MTNIMINVMTAWKKVHSHSGQLSTFLGEGGTKGYHTEPGAGTYHTYNIIYTHSYSYVI